MWRISRADGFTLLEVLLAAAASLILFSMLAYTLVPVMSMSARNGVQVDLQQEAMVLLGRLDFDLSQTTAGGVTLGPPDNGSSHAVAINRFVSFGSSGTLDFDNKLIVYGWDAASGVCTRKSWPPQPPLAAVTFMPTSPAAVSPDAVALVAGSTNGTERPLSTRVKSFDVTLSATGLFMVHFVLRAPLPLRQDVESFETSRTYYLRTP
jgi:type II secretory pathway pseudopilin PulG